MLSLTGAKKSVFQGVAAVSCLILSSGYAYCQNKPGIDGMAPTKWISIRHTQAPGRSYKSVSSNDQVCTQEDIYFKVWLPIFHKPTFSMAIGPQYRTEQLEFEGENENVANSLSHWNLRYAGADLRSMVSLNPSSWLMFNINANKSGNFGDYSFSKYPVNYTLSVAYVKKKSNNKEFGAGLLVNNSFTGVTVLPILIYHYNFSKNTGIELNLPYKMAWRYNISESDILFVKAEAQNRNYLIHIEDETCSFRSINLDMGVAYNKAFSKLIGAEAFIGYRQNVSNRLPEDVIAVKKSGMAFSLEFYVRPPLKK
jgi:hypothetical protein